MGARWHDGFAEREVMFVLGARGVRDGPKRLRAKRVSQVVLTQGRMLFRFLLCSLLVLASTACGESIGPEFIDFGARYDVQDVPDPPGLRNDSLYVTVSYGACGRNREFQLRARVRAPEAAALWLVKVTPAEGCDMLVTERRGFALSERIRSFHTVTLLAPGDRAFPLRP